MGVITNLFYSVFIHSLIDSNEEAFLIVFFCIVEWDEFQMRKKKVWKIFFSNLQSISNNLTYFG